MSPQQRCTPSSSSSSSSLDRRIVIPMSNHPKILARSSPLSEGTNSSSSSVASSVSTLSSSTTHPSKRAKVVHFYPVLRVREIPMRKDMDQDERESVWFLPHEYEDIKRSLHITVQMIRLGDPFQVLDRKNSTLCSRGLEWKERQSCSEFSRREVRKRGLHAVWQEQFSQWQEGRVDPERLASVYEKSTEASKVIAHWLALMDSRNAASNDTADGSGRVFQREVESNSTI